VSSTTKSVFRKSAILSGLVTQAELDRAEAELRDSIGGTDEVTEWELAAALKKLGIVTNYQAEQMRSGRTKFTLGPYIITDFIGQGGMGQVYKAEHKVMGRECAVKVLPLSKSTPEAISTFTREIRTQAKLDHPNLVHAYDAGQDGNVHYLVTEFVPGTDLRRLIRSDGALNVQLAASIISQAALALDYAHERGLIHRDVKPGNILVTPEGIAKVSDLGLAGFMNEDDDPRAGKIVGTADYLAPEQIRNPHETNKVSDIYSLGCTLYYAITGKVPFPGGTPALKARRHLEETPWHPRRFNPDVSEEFVEVIADMMEKDPETRIVSAAEVVARLEPWSAEAAPIPTHQLTQSRWAPPPLPMGNDDMQETDPASGDLEDLDSSRQESLGHVFQNADPQSTDSLFASAQETKRVGRLKSPPVPPPLPSGAVSPYKRKERFLVVLAISIPTSFLLGTILGFLLRGSL